MSKFSKLYKAIEEGKTLLGVGPMSKACIDATIELANDNQIPIILIASRRQIECQEFDGGYVWNTEDFAKYVKEKDEGKFVYLARDHGGPWQGTNEFDLSYPTATKRAQLSYMIDVKSGFDIIHIDPSLKKRALKHIVSDVNDLYGFCETVASLYEKEVIYEAGTEEHSGQIANIANFISFVSQIKEQSPKIKFVVGNMGLWVKEVENVGEFDEEQAKHLVDVCNSSNVYLKGHNTDYVGEETLKRHPKLGVHSINVAPEFGVKETEELLHLFEFYRMDKQRNEFIKLAVESKKWEKWMKDLNEEVPDLYKAKICGHYVFSDPRVVELKNELRKKCDLDELLKGAVKSSIKTYLNCLGWKTS